MRLTNAFGVRREAKLVLLCVAAFAFGILGVNVISKLRPRHASSVEQGGRVRFQ